MNWRSALCSALRKTLGELQVPPLAAVVCAVRQLSCHLCPRHARPGTFALLHHLPKAPVLLCQ